MHQTIYKIVLIFFIVNLSCAQNRSLNKGRITIKNYYSEIPYENVNGKLIIPVIIKDKTYRFLFDTGAPNLITSQLKELLEIESGKNISVSDANNTSQQMEVVKIPLFTLGNVSFKNTTSLVYNGTDNIIFDCLKIDGIIGSNIFKKSIVQVLSKKQLIIITNDPKKLNLKNQKSSKLKLIGSQSSPYFTIVLNGENRATEDVLFDSGASGFYDLCLKHYKTFKSHNVVTTLSKGKGSNSIGLFGISEKQDQYSVIIPKLSINTIAFNNVATITESDNNSRVGSGLLNYGNVTIDFKNKKFYFDAFNADFNLEEKQLGFTPTMVSKKLVVGIVWDESLKDKIQYGDEIIEVNGIDLRSIDICDYITKDSIFKESDILDIVFKNSKGETNKILLKKQ